MGDSTELLPVATGNERWRKGYLTPPVPYDERALPPDRRGWSPDYGERAVPKGKGFITDFVFHTRGFETPTLSVVWSALFLLASAVKREAWISWVPRPLYPNLYMLVIGPAGRVKKTTAVAEIGLPILEGFQQYIRNVNISGMKNIQVLKDKATPEAMLQTMLPENRPGVDLYLRDESGDFLKGEDGVAVVYKKTSETSIIISELSTFLTKRSYGEGTLQLLLDLYDCRDTWEWRTMSQGVKYLRRLCTSFIAGTTVDGMRNSIPHAAMGDGFMSRTIPVYVPYTKRRFPYPRMVEGAPSTDEMQKRLAWVAEHGLGEFALSPEADVEYERWYTYNHRMMEEHPGISGAMSRMSHNLLKVALLVRLSRYDARGGTIELQDLQDGIRLLDVTYSSLPFLLSQLDEDEIMAESGKLLDYLKRHHKIVRKNALSSLRIRADMLTTVVEELCSRGVVKVVLGDREGYHPWGNTLEEYVYMEDQDDRAGEDRGPGAATSLSYTGDVWDDENGLFDSGSEPYVPPEMVAPPENTVAPARKGRKPKASPFASSEEFSQVRRVGESKPRGRPPAKYKGDSEDYRMQSGPNQDVPVQEAEEEA